MQRGRRDMHELYMLVGRPLAGIAHQATRHFPCQIHRAKVLGGTHWFAMALCLGGLAPGFPQEVRMEAELVPVATLV